MTPTSLTVPEARVILRADEALDLTYEARLAAGTTFSDEEREAWVKLVESANDRIAAYEGKIVKSAPTISGRPENPGREAISFAVDMMSAPGAPLFETKREKREASVDLALALARSREHK